MVEEKEKLEKAKEILLGEQKTKKQEKKSDQYPPKWDYSKKGSWIVGVVKNVKKIKGKTVLEVDGEGEEGGKKFQEMKTIWCSTVLERLVRKEKIKEGDIIGIKQVGMRKGDKGEYYVFRIIKI